MNAWDSYMMYIVFNLCCGVAGTILALQDKHYYAWIPWALVALSRFKMPKKEDGDE